MAQELECVGAVVSFARETLGVDLSKCGAHVTGMASKQHQDYEKAGVALTSPEQVWWLTSLALLESLIKHETWRKAHDTF